MKKSVIVAGFVFLVLCLVVQAQTPPKPGPEQQKLQVFVGTWTMDGEQKAGPWGPAGKITGKDTVESLGGFFVQRNFQGKGPGFEVKGTHIFGYDPVKKSYIQSSYASDGSFSSGTITVNGNTWNFMGTGAAGGKAVQERCAVTFGANNTTLAVKCEASTDGKTWAPSFEGKSTKAK